MPGGGTVAYVNPAEHVYLTDIEHREEGGTPAIVESIRAGLVFRLKEAVGAEAIRAREESFIRRAIERWAGHPNIEILGNPTLDRLSIVSFVVRHDGTRGTSTTTSWSRCSTTCSGSSRAAAAPAPGRTATGCSGSTSTRSHEFEREIARGCEGIKPGWVRVNFNYFISEPVFEFILGAVELVATDGWRLLPHYRFEPAPGCGSHAGGTAEPPMSLRDVSYTGGRMTFPSHRRTEPESRLAEYLDEARRIMADPPAPTSSPPNTSPSTPTSRPCAGSRSRTTWRPARGEPEAVLAGPLDPVEAPQSAPEQTRDQPQARRRAERVDPDVHDRGMAGGVERLVQLVRPGISGRDRERGNEHQTRRDPTAERRPTRSASHHSTASRA